MADVFKEQLIKQEQTQKDRMLRILSIVGAVILGILALVIGGALFGVILAAGITWGCIYIQAMFKKEYEYALTNEEMDIDVIYNKERRKRVLSVNLKSMNVMASIQDERHKDSLARAVYTIDASDGKESKDTYAIITSTEKGLTKVFITPNEQMLELMYRQAPNKVMKYRG